MRIAICIGTVAAVLACACSKDRRRSIDESAAPPSRPSLAIFFDGERVAAVASEQITARTPLVDLLDDAHRDVDGWIRVEARSDDGRLLAIPLARYRDHLPCLERSKAGKLSLGWFMRTRATAGGACPSSDPRLALAPVERIDVFSKKPAPPPAPGLLVVVDQHRRIRIGDDRLSKLPANAPDDSDRSRSRRERRHARGWALPDVLALAVSPERIASVSLVGKDGRVMRFPSSRVRKGPPVRIKRNRQNLLVARWTSEEGHASRLRGIERIEVTLAPEADPTRR